MQIATECLEFAHIIKLWSTAATIVQVHTMKVPKTAAVIVALNIKSIAARQRTLQFSKAQKELVIGSKTSKAAAKDAWFTTMPLSLSLSLPTIPLDDSKFGSQLFNPVPLSPSLEPSELDDKIVPSNFPVSLNPIYPLPGIPFAPSNDGGSLVSNFDDIILAPSQSAIEDETASPSYYSDELTKETQKMNRCITKRYETLVSTEVELLYFYRLESLIFVPSIIDEVEKFLVEIACNLTRDERELRSPNTTTERVIAASSTPKDAVSTACKSVKCVPILKKAP